MKRGGTTRQRAGDLCEPVNYRRLGMIDYPWYLPMPFIGNSLNWYSPIDGVIVRPFVLPKPLQFNRIAWRTNGVGTVTYIRFGFYETDPLNKTDFPYPGKLIWGMPNWVLINTMGQMTDGDYAPAVTLPGNQLLWAAQAGYTTYTYGMEGSLLGIGSSDVNTGISQVDHGNILGAASAGAVGFTNSYWATNLGDNYAWPNPFPTSNVLMDSQFLILFGLTLV